MTTAPPAPKDVLEKVDTLGPPSTPVTTPEVADGFDCTQRTIYNRLKTLVDDGVLQTKKVGANSRVWWRAIGNDIRRNGGTFDQRVPAPLREKQALSDSEMAERIREFEWAETPLGPIDEWPAELQTAVAIMLGANEAIGIYWGDDLTLLYNDLARDIIGEKHPEALGQPGRNVFPEAWDTLGPLHEQVLAGKGATRLDEFLLPIERAGEIEDVWWDSSYSPIPLSDGSIGGVFNVAVDVSERVQAEHKLRELKQKSEAKYRTLFESIDEGFCIIEMLFDEDDQPVDYRFLETNPTFEEITGLSDAEGKRMRDLEPDHEDHWFEIYGTVARTGEDVRFTERAEHLGNRWYDVYAFRIGDPDERQVAILFDDVTERKETEEALRESEAKLATELAATQALQEISTELIGENDVQTLSERVLESALEIMDADFASVQLYDPDRNDLILVANHGFTREAESAWDRVTSEHGTSCGESLRTGERVIVADVETNTDVVGSEELENFRQTGIRSVQTTPLVSRSGDVLGMFSTHWETARDLTEPELGRLDVLARQAADLIERQQTTEALRESQERLDSFVTATSEVVYRMSPDWSEMYYLDGKDFIVDTDESREAWLEEYIPPDEEARVMAVIEEAIETKSTYELEHQVVQVDGTKGWMHSRAVPVLDDDGEITEWFGTATDITERKQREERQKFLLELSDALRPLTDPVEAQQAAMKRLAEHLDVMRASYFEMDADQDGFTQAAGYETEDCVQLPDRMRMSDFGSEIVAEYRAGRTVAVNDTEADIQLDSQRQAHRAIGVRAWIGVPLVKEGRLLVVLGVHHSTPRKWTSAEVRLIEEFAERTWAAAERARAEEALREKEERLTAATNTAEIGIWELDLQTDESLYTSPRYAEILGYDEIPGDWNLERALGHCHPDDRERLATYLEEGLGKRTFEGRIARTDGKQRWISVESTVYENSGGTPVRAVGTILDITERKKRERKQEYQLKLNDVLRPLTDPAAIQEEACRVLGEHLDVKRSQYGELDLDREIINITRDYYRGGDNVNDLPSLVGEYSFDDFPAHAEAWLEQRSLAVNDAERDMALSEVERAGMKQRQVRATLSTPLVKNGVPVVVMAVTSSVPRRWTDEDIALLEETAERTWDAVQRAQVEQDLRESEARFRNVFENDMVPMAQSMQDGRITDANSTFLDLLGYTREELEAGKLDWTDRTPDEYHERDQTAIAEVNETGACEPYEKEFIHKDGHRIPIVIGGGEFDQRSDENILFAIDITERKEIEEELAAELEAIKRLQEVSTQITEENEDDVLYESVLDTAMDLMNAEFGTIQRLDPQAYELDMLSYREFTAETISQWDRVDTETASSCGKALQTEERVIIPDVETCEFIEQGEDLEAFTRIGIQSMQSTPLISRSGELLGMISTHWTDPHEPSERDLHLLDVIARQVADLMEQRAAYEAVSESEASLQRLNTATQELIDAEPATIADRVAPLVREVLDLEYASLWQYNDQRGDLDEYAADVSPDVDGDAVKFPTEIAEQAWETFVGTDVVVANDLDAPSDTTSPLRSRAFVPLGRHGVVCLGSTEADTFDERTIDLVETVASTIETTWNRAESERQLEQQNEELTRFDRLNSLIREIDTSLVEAETVDAIDDAVCERLAASPRYEFAWIGEFDANADAVRPRSWAGVEASTVEELASANNNPAIATDPFVTAIRTREMQVIEDIATDARNGSCRELTLKRGARSCFSIPLTYDESVYGVLVVYGDSPARNWDTDVLAEFGRTIAHTINAVETRDSFQADSIAELTLRSTAADTPLCRLAQAIDSELEFEGLVPGTDDVATVFFSVPSVVPEQVVAAGEDVLGITDVTSLAERDDGPLFEARLSESSLASLVLEQNATVRSLQIDAGTATVVVDLPGSGSVRAFVDALTREVPDLELLSRRTRTREPGSTLQTTVLEGLTPRQQEVLQLAYRSGYFEMPRVRTGEELADTLDVVPSTFAKHIRRAERNLLDIIFDNGHETLSAGSK
jgi:PAS domain S-box-containing protein